MSSNLAGYAALSANGLMLLEPWHEYRGTSSIEVHLGTRVALGTLSARNDDAAELGVARSGGNLLLGSVHGRGVISEAIGGGFSAAGVASR